MRWFCFLLCFTSSFVWGSEKKIIVPKATIDQKALILPTKLRGVISYQQTWHKSEGYFLLGLANAPTYSKNLGKNIGYFGLDYFNQPDYQLLRAGLFIDGYHNFNKPVWGHLKTRWYLYQQTIKDLPAQTGFGVGWLSVFQPISDVFFSVGADVRPIIFSFDWSSKVYLSYDINLESEIFLGNHVAIVNRWQSSLWHDSTVAPQPIVQQFKSGLRIQW